MYQLECDYCGTMLFLMPNSDIPSNCRNCGGPNRNPPVLVKNLSIAPVVWRQYGILEPMAFSQFTRPVVTVATTSVAWIGEW